MTPKADIESKQAPLSSVCLCTVTLYVRRAFCIPISLSWGYLTEKDEVNDYPDYVPNDEVPGLYKPGSLKGESPQRDPSLLARL